jgi:nucleoside-diphosphate-sugar epimerase
MRTVPRYVVIGATGYIGSKLFATAAQGGEVLGSSSSAASSQFTHLNLATPADFVERNIRPGDVVYFTAAISAPDVCASNPGWARQVNVVGTGEVIEQALRVGASVIFFSTDAVYGDQDVGFDESLPCRPAGDYAAMKHEIEERFKGSAAFKSLRLSYVFSCEDKFTRYLRGCVRSGTPAQIFHPFLRSVVYRADVVAGALGLAAQWDDVGEQNINFGGPEILSRVQFAEYVRGAGLSDLCFEVVHPEPAFFQHRPRSIAMRSQILSRLLGRSPLSIDQAARIELACAS